jgi:uncharacterized protein (TIGR02147 family)
MISIYQYLDYRKYLKDDFERRKSRNDKFSIRAFAKKLDINAGTVTRILSGKRNISENTAEKLIKYLKSRKRGEKYFKLLVKFNQTDNTMERRICYEQIKSYRKVNVKSLGADQYEYFSKWYNVAIREILNFYDFHGNYKKLAGMINPRIKPGQARQAIRDLEKLQLIKKNKKNKWELCNRLITTGDKWKNTDIHTFQINMNELGKKAMDNFNRHERDISTITLSLSQKGFKKIAELLKKTRKQIIEIANSDKKVDRAYQANFQLFPLSKEYKGK